MKPATNPKEYYEPCSFCSKRYAFLEYGHPKNKINNFDSLFYKDCPIYNAKPELNETLDTKSETNEGADSDNQAPAK
jgi:hypothetical protein